MVLKHAMTVDVEDYFHVSAFNSVIRPDQWEEYPSRVTENTTRILKLFEKNRMQATFFVLGWVAEREPALVKEILDQGHEIASHGYSHQLVYRQTPELFREETYKSKSILEDICQRPVVGYRAASYSITARSMWALDILGELGFEWDSSIFPVYHDNYGVPTSPCRPYRIKLDSGQALIEFPLTTARVLGLRLPAAGGGYFRQYPYAFSRWLFKRAERQQRTGQIFYLHPWEIDTEQPRVEGAGWKSSFRHYRNIDKFMPRLSALVESFSFGTVSEVLSSVSIDQTLTVPELIGEQDQKTA